MSKKKLSKLLALYLPYVVIGLLATNLGEAWRLAVDKYQKKTIMAGELLYPAKLWDHLAGILEWKNLTLERVYGAKPYTMDDLKAWVAEFGMTSMAAIINADSFFINLFIFGSSLC